MEILTCWSFAIGPGSSYKHSQLFARIVARGRLFLECVKYMAGNGIECRFGLTLPSFIIGVAATNLLAATPASAQGAPPPPGVGSPQSAPSYAPIPGGPSFARPGGYGGPGSMPQQTLGGLPMPGPAGGTAGGYASLPLSATDAGLRLDELRAIMSSARPKEFQEALLNYITWLSDVADGHWRMSTAFAKNEANKPQAEAEKQSALKFGGLKRQAMLLEAQFLVKQRRFPEAVAPLIDIVVAEPRSATGKSAYQLLQDIGFSNEAGVSNAAQIK